jgi:hypothetical protein
MPSPGGRAEQRAESGDHADMAERRYSAYAERAPTGGVAALRADLQAARKQQHTIRRIFNRLVEEYGFTAASCTCVRHYEMTILDAVGDRAGEPVCVPFCLGSMQRCVLVCSPPRTLRT